MSVAHASEKDRERFCSEKCTTYDLRIKAKCKSLKVMTVHGHDPKHYKGVSKAKKQHVEVQARHVLKAFEILERHY